MVAYDHSIEEIKTIIRNIKSKGSFDSLIIDLLTTNWNSLAFKPNQLISLFLEIPKNQLFNSDCIDLITNYLPLSTNYSSILVNGFVVELIEDARIPSLYKIYKKFGDFVQIQIALAKCPLTPLDILQELIFSDNISVIVAIGDNDGDSAKELLRNEDMKNRVLYAKKILNIKFS